MIRFAAAMLFCLNDYEKEEFKKAEDGITEVLDDRSILNDFYKKVCKIVDTKKFDILIFYINDMKRTLSVQVTPEYLEVVKKEKEFVIEVTWEFRDLYISDETILKKGREVGGDYYPKEYDVLTLFTNHGEQMLFEIDDAEIEFIEDIHNNCMSFFRDGRQYHMCKVVYFLK